jgi:hypothetical protein
MFGCSLFPPRKGSNPKSILKRKKFFQRRSKEAMVLVYFS